MFAEWPVEAVGWGAGLPGPRVVALGPYAVVEVVAARVQGLQEEAAAG